MDYRDEGKTLLNIMASSILDELTEKGIRKPGHSDICWITQINYDDMLAHLTVADMITGADEKFIVHFEQSISLKEVRKIKDDSETIWTDPSVDIQALSIVQQLPQLTEAELKVVEDLVEAMTNKAISSVPPEMYVDHRKQMKEPTIPENITITKPNRMTKTIGRKKVFGII